jgi:hypothetical protein
MAFYRAEALGLAVLGRIERETGSLERALAATERAQELLDRHGSELLDRIVITGSHCLVLDSCKRGAEARALVRGLRRRMRGDNQRIADPELRRAQRGYSLQLLEAVLSPDGPVYPRLPQG